MLGGYFQAMILKPIEYCYNCYYLDIVPVLSAISLPNIGVQKILELYSL